MNVYGIIVLSPGMRMGCFWIGDLRGGIMNKLLVLRLCDPTAVAAADTIFRVLANVGEKAVEA